MINFLDQLSTPYQSSLKSLVGDQKYIVSKIFIRVESSFLFSIKKILSNPQDHRNHKLELFGGYLEANESPENGLLRELIEEDPTHILSSLFKEAISQIRPLSFFILSGKNRQYFIFSIEMGLDEYKTFSLNFDKRDHPESYGVTLLPMSEIYPDLKSAEEFTPKSKKIFYKIKKLIEKDQKNCP